MFPINSHRRWVLCLMVSVLVLVNAPPAVLASPSSSPLSQYEYGACSKAADKIALKDEIERHIRAVLENPDTPLDIDKIVEEKWSELGLDKVVDSEVRRIVIELDEREPYHEKLLSSWWAPKAEEYAQRVAKDAFTSPIFEDAMMDLSAVLGKEIADRLNTEIVRAASSGFRCLQEYAGAQYGERLYDRFGEEIKKTMPGSSTMPLAPVNPPGPEGVGITTLTLTVMAIVMPRIMEKLSERIVFRVAGKIVERVLGKGASSLIPLAGWVIAAGMLAFDLWEGGKGALPQIQDSLQSEDTKTRIRQEIAGAIREALPDQSNYIALSIASDLVDQWEKFCQEGDICSLVEKYPAFADFINGKSMEELEQIIELVKFFQEELGQTELNHAFDTGNFQRLLQHLPLILNVLRDSRDTDTALAWTELAGENLSRVVVLSIHRRTDPEEWTQTQLATLLDLPKAGDIDKLLSLSVEKRNVLLSLPLDAMQSLVVSCPLVALDTIAAQMLQPGHRPEIIAQDVVDCKWIDEQPTAIALTIARSSAPTVIEPTAPVTTGSHLSPYETPLQPSTQDSSPIDAGWPIATLLLVGMLLAGVFIGRRLSPKEETQRPQDVQPEKDSEELI